MEMSAFSLGVNGASLITHVAKHTQRSCNDNRAVIALCHCAVLSLSTNAKAGW